MAVSRKSFIVYVQNPLLRIYYKYKLVNVQRKNEHKTISWVSPASIALNDWAISLAHNVIYYRTICDICRMKETKFSLIWN